MVPTRIKPFRKELLLGNQSQRRSQPVPKCVQVGIRKWEKPCQDGQGGSPPVKRPHLGSWQKRILFLGIAGGIALVILSATLLNPLQAAQPKRQFPDTSDAILVYVDQLPGQLTRPQLRFAASHYVGTQKLLSHQIDLLRSQNRDFLMLHYRLGTRQAEPRVIHIHMDQWGTDWDEVNRHDDWFIYTRGPNRQRVYQVVSGNREYIMDISGRYNGNTQNGWKEYWVKTVIAEARACHADGVFADSTHPPYAVPAELNDSPLGAPPYLGYIPHLEEFYEYVYKKLDEAGVYFIPNIGHLITGWDTTEGYYKNVHGAMVEGFGFRGNTADWRLQQNRTLKLLNNGKIYIAQNGAAAENIEERLWYLANFLLVKHHRSYVNIFVRGPGLEGQLHWWPEYELKLGQPVRPLPKTIEQCQHATGVYFREFERGLVLVNPQPNAQTVRLADVQAYQRVEPWGGGIVDSSGRPPRGGIRLHDCPRQIQLGPWSGMILLKVSAQQKQE